jgi:hypothetical protein
MKHKKIWVLCIVGIIGVIVVIIGFAFRATYYENSEFPIWTNSRGIWSYNDEKWLMRDFDFSSGRVAYSNKKRDAKIVDKYYIGSALCYGGVKAKNETTTYSRNPYGFGITIYGLPNVHKSFTLRNIAINSRSGNNLSHLANSNLPITVALKNESETEEMLVWGYYDTDEIFNFRNEPIIIECTLQINKTDGSETGTVAFKLKPKHEFSLFLIFAYLLGA